MTTTIPIFLLLVALTLLAIYSHIEAKKIEDPHRRFMAAVMTVFLYLANCALVSIVISHFAY